MNQGEYWFQYQEEVVNEQGKKIQGWRFQKAGSSDFNSAKNEAWSFAKESGKTVGVFCCVGVFRTVVTRSVDTSWEGVNAIETKEDGK